MVVGFKMTIKCALQALIRDVVDVKDFTVLIKRHRSIRYMLQYEFTFPAVLSLTTAAFIYVIFILF